MTKPFKLSTVALGVVVGVALALPASAQQQTKEPKQKKQATQTQRVTAAQRSEQGRGLYYQGQYLGDDPDPFIRLQIQRDLGARFPGND
jgi:uncharacterized protein HemX